MEEELRGRWAADVGRSRAAGAAVDDLLARYREPHRRYHGLTHVLRVLRTIDELLPGVAAEHPVEDPVAVRLAAWYHDAVYDPRAAAGTNEASSAALAARVLGDLGQDPVRVDAVVRLVEVTTTHAAGAPDEVVLCDADLAILAADPAAYSAYVNGVRAEYAHVAEPDWRVGRAGVLRALLDRAALFHTPALRRHEPTARANITAELTTLTAGP
jgi:predicted metal-dependent HD superfamily phosphohydrolase